MGYAPANQYNQVDPHAMYPSYSMKQHQHQHMGLVPSPLSAAKLPSLEGLLKKMQDAPSSPSQSVYSPPPQSESAVRNREQRLSPVGSQMPSLRTIINTNVTKSVFQDERAHSPLHLSYAPVTQSQMSFPARKRSWNEVSSLEAGFYPAKERAVSPMLSVGSVGPHRSRASKYCKIEGCERVSQRNNLCHSHGGKRLCKEDGCSSKDRGNGYCIKHGGGKICSMGGCEKKARRKGLCTQHFRVCDDGSESMSPLHYGSHGVGSI
uniref:Uncharacterized protein n=1 Tax=Globisporangium ultimum (strain ATCC 200006 / CBS 805.95 / DAOM BR144) TaxID=431595 RepID=K3X6D5_GLOUD